MPFAKGQLPHNKISSHNIPRGWKRNPETESVTTPLGEFKSLKAANKFHAEELQRHVKERKEKKKVGGIAWVDSFFIGRVSQMEQLVDHINEELKCRSEGCEGKLVLAQQEMKGLGGALNLLLQCSDCRKTIPFSSSPTIGDTQRLEVPTLIMLSSLLGGFQYAGYERQMTAVLGDNTFSDKTWQKFIAWLGPKVKSLLDRQVALAHDHLKGFEETKIGSFKRAVTTSDGAWHIRGHHSGNASFIVVDYFTKALLQYAHLSMRGRKEEEKWKGTAKGAEGEMAQTCFQALADIGLNIECNFQDGDSTSEQAIESVFEDVAYGCRNHLCRASGNILQSHKGKKSDPTMEEKCICYAKKHKNGCGCITDEFIIQAKKNILILLKKCKEPSEFKKEINELGKYHSKDIHVWEGGKCSFHHQKVCSCKLCPGDAEPTCEGTVYHTKHPLKCGFHAKLYERECENRGNEAYQLIHSELGSGHSNLPESFWSIVIRYRSKTVDLDKDAYELTTNLGLLHANQSFMSTLKGDQYNFKLDLLEACGIDVPETVRHAFMTDAVERQKISKKNATPEEKKKKSQSKSNRRSKNEARKKWMKNRKVLHNYTSSTQEGNESGEEADFEDDEVDETVPYTVELTEEDPDPSHSSEPSQLAAKTMNIISAKTLLCFFDLEATGLYSDRDDTTQLAAKNVILEDGEFVVCESGFNTYVKTLRKMNAEAQRITGILPHRDPRSQLRNAPEFSVAVNKWLDWVEEESLKLHCNAVLLVGHNIRTFDLRMLINQGHRNKVDVPAIMAKKRIVYYLDTLSFLRKHKDKITWPSSLTATASGAKSLSMASIYNASFVEPLPNAHQADGDVEGLIKVMTSPHIKESFKNSKELQSIPGLIADMKKKKTKAIQVALSAPRTRAVQSGNKRKRADGNQVQEPNKRGKKCECGYFRHPKESTCSLKPASKQKA
jgi:DNA polymerase III epsilon subunit-like protein